MAGSPHDPEPVQARLAAVVQNGLGLSFKEGQCGGCGLSPRQVATMRKVRRELGDAAYDARTWRGTWSRYKGLVRRRRGLGSGCVA